MNNHLQYIFFNILFIMVRNNGETFLLNLLPKRFCRSPFLWQIFFFLNSTSFFSLSCLVFQNADWSQLFKLLASLTKRKKKRIPPLFSFFSSVLRNVAEFHYFWFRSISVKNRMWTFFNIFYKLIYDFGLSVMANLLKYFFSVSLFLRFFAYS